MTHKVKLAQEFISSYDGSLEHLTNIMNKVQQLIDSGESLENIATSITYSVGSYDTIMTINL